MSRLVVSGPNLQQAIDALERVDLLPPLGHRIYGRRNLSHKEIVELLALTLGMNRGEIAINVSTSTAANTLRALSTLSTTNEDAHRRMSTLLADVEAALPSGSTLESAFGVTIPTARSLEQKQEWVSGQLNQLAIDTHDAIAAILAVERKQAVPKHVATYYHGKDSKINLIDEFLSDATNAVLSLANHESRLGGDVIRPYLMAVLMGKKPPVLRQRAGVI